MDASDSFCCPSLDEDEPNGYDSLFDEFFQDSQKSSSPKEDAKAERKASLLASLMPENNSVGTRVSPGSQQQNQLSIKNSADRESSQAHLDIDDSPYVTLLHYSKPVDKTVNEFSCQMTNAPAATGEGQLQSQINRHHRAIYEQSYLDKTIAIVLDEEDDVHLKRLESLEEAQRHTGNVNSAQINQAIMTDEQAIGWHDDINDYVSSIAKVSALAGKGRLAFAGACVLLAADSMKPADPWTEQLADGACGVAQTYALRWSANRVGAINTSPGVQRLSLGVAGRTISSGLNWRSYVDEQGAIAPTAGISTTLERALDPHSMLADTAAMGATETVRKAGLSPRMTTLNQRMLSPLAATAAYNTSQRVADVLSEPRSDGENTAHDQDFGPYSNEPQPHLIPKRPSSNARISVTPAK